MPDRYGDADEPPVDQSEIVDVPPPPDPMPDELYAAEMRRRGINACGLCDADGYRLSGELICDHIDHRPAAERGIALCREALEKGKQP